MRGNCLGLEGTLLEPGTFYGCVFGRWLLVLADTHHLFHAS